MIFFKSFFLSNASLANLRLLNHTFVFLDIPCLICDNLQCQILKLWYSVGWTHQLLLITKKIVNKRWRNTLNLLYFLPPGTSLQFVFSNLSFTQFVLKVSIFLLQLTIFLFKSINNRILDTHNTFIHFLCVDVMTVFLETFLDIFIALAYTIKFCTNTIFKFCQRWIDISL